MHIVAYDVSRTAALVHADGLGLLPIHFYITVDDFLTVGKCRLEWRCRDDIGVIFERWLDIPPSVSSSAKHADLSPKIIRDASPAARTSCNDRGATTPRPRSSSLATARKLKREL